MKRDIVVVGAGGHCRAVLALLEAGEEWKPIGVVDLSFSGDEEYIMGIRVMGEAALKYPSRSLSCAALALGDNALRASVYRKLQKAGWEIPNLIWPGTVISPSAQMHDGNIFMARAYIGPEVVIGANNLINTAVILEHECRLGSHNHLAPGTVVCGRVQLGDEIFLGAGSVVKDNVSVRNNIVIGAGATVVRSLGDAGVYSGTPARRHKG